MFKAGDIVRLKSKADLYAFVAYIQHNPPQPLSYIKIQGLNFNWHGDSMLTYREAQLLWEKVE